MKDHGCREGSERFDVGGWSSIGLGGPEVAILGVGRFAALDLVMASAGLGAVMLDRIR